MTKSRFFRGLGHFPVDRPCYTPTCCPHGPTPLHRAAGLGRGALGVPRGWGLLTGVVSHISINGEAPNVIGLYHVRVPFLAVAGIVQHIVERLGRDILAGDASLWGDEQSGRGAAPTPRAQSCAHLGTRTLSLFLCVVACPCAAIKPRARVPWRMPCTYGAGHIPASGQPRQSHWPRCQHAAQCKGRRAAGSRRTFCPQTELPAGPAGAWVP